LGIDFIKTSYIAAGHVLSFAPFNALKMPPQKRHWEAIDLTEEESPFYSSQRASTSQGYAQSSQSSPDGRAPKQSRTLAPSRTASGASQQDPVYIDDDEEEDVSATQGFTEQEYSWMLYGQMHAKIVGVRYYDGYATVGEMVVVRREPSNPYDSKFL
jgi:SWI/SNF-related matrix-associated actin-dependent regulator of chromatin subfamily A3